MPESTAPRAIKQEPFNLLGLPTDILDYLSIEHLNSRNFFNLRLTCREIREQTSSAFGRRYFKHMKFMISPRSLRALQTISNDKQLSQFVRHVGIGTERLQSEPGDAFRRFGFYKRIQWYKVYGEKYKRELESQERMEDNETDVSILTEAFRSLPNLESVGVGGPQIALTKAERVWDLANMQSWGAEYLIRKLGAGDGISGQNWEDCPRLNTPWRALLLQDEDKKYRAFKVIFEVLQKFAPRNIKLDLYIHTPEGEDMPFQVLHANNQAALKHTRNLTLDFTGEPEITEYSGSWTERLFKTATSATSIQLVGGYNLEPIFQQLTGGHYAHLRMLRLVNIAVFDLEIMLAMLKHVSPTIAKIEMSDVIIDQRRGTPELRRGEGFALRDKWNEVLEVVLDLPHLESVSLRKLKEYRGYSTHDRCTDDEDTEDEDTQDEDVEHKNAEDEHAKDAHIEHGDAEDRHTKDEDMEDGDSEGDESEDNDLKDKSPEYKYLWGDEVQLRGRQEIADILGFAAKIRVESDYRYHDRVKGQWLWWGCKWFRTSLQQRLKCYPN